jgi:hypothetical protein
MNPSSEQPFGLSWQILCGVSLRVCCLQRNKFVPLKSVDPIYIEGTYYLLHVASSHFTPVWKQFWKQKPEGVVDKRECLTAKSC